MRSKGKGMLEYLRKKSFKKSLWLTGIGLIAGIVLLVIFGPDCLKVLKGPVDFKNITEDDFEKKPYVVIDYDFNYGCFAEETSTTTRNGIEISSHSSGAVYAIPVSDIRSYFESGDTLEFMGIYFGSDYYDDLQVIDDNMNDFNAKYDEWYNDFSMTNKELFSTLDSYLTVKGQVLPMDSTMFDYFEGMFAEYGYSGDEISKFCHPYYIKVDGMQHGSVVSVCIFAGLGLALIILMIVLMVYAANGGYLKSMKKALAKKGSSELERVCAEFDSGVNFNKNLKVGRSYIIDSGSMVPKVVSLQDCIWAYMQVTKNKQYFVTVSTTYSVTFRSKNKEINSVLTRNKDDAMRLLDLVHQRFPGIILGYSNDLEFLYKSDMNQFLALYQQNEEASRAQM